MTPQTPTSIMQNLIKVHQEYNFGTQKEYNIRIQIEIAIIIFENELEFLEEFEEFYKLSEEHVIKIRISQLKQAINDGKKEIEK